jgi:two-component system cell cycle sensor histidine kinase/response regulator CckA
MTPPLDLWVLIVSASVERTKRLQAMGLLTRSAMHELNNHMTAIVGFAELVLDQLPEGDPLREDLEQIRMSTRNAVETARELSLLGRALSPLGSMG